MPRVKNLLIIVNSGSDKAHNQYAAYIVALIAKQIAKTNNVTVYYGPQGVGIARKGALAGFAVQNSMKKLIADQIKGLSSSDLPDNLEQLARYEKEQLGVSIVCSATFSVIDGLAGTVEDVSNIEDFIAPVKLPQAAEAMLGADKILYF